MQKKKFYSRLWKTEFLTLNERSWKGTKDKGAKPSTKKIVDIHAEKLFCALFWLNNMKEEKQQLRWSTAMKSISELFFKLELISARGIFPVLTEIRAYAFCDDKLFRSHTTINFLEKSFCRDSILSGMGKVLFFQFLVKARIILSDEFYCCSYSRDQKQM